MKTKAFLSILILCCISFTSKAQIDKGGILLGGDFGYSNSSNKQATNTFPSESFNANIQIGQVISNNTVAGIIFTVGHSNNHVPDFPDSNYYKSHMTRVGVFFRKYKKIGKDFNFFGEAEGVYSHSSTDQGDNVNVANVTNSVFEGGTVSIAPGISYALFYKFYLELMMPDLVSVSYIHSSNVVTQGEPEITTTGTGNKISLATSLNSNLLSIFGIGFKFILPNKI
jgi:hypothetical protein